MSVEATFAGLKSMFWVHSAGDREVAGEYPPGYICQHINHFPDQTRLCRCCAKSVEDLHHVINQPQTHDLSIICHTV